MDKKFLEDLKESKARVALLIEGTEWKKLGLDGVLFVNKPRYALARLNNLFEESDFENEFHHFLT